MLEKSNYIWMYFIIIGMPLFILKSVDFYDKVEFVEASVIGEIDTLKAHVHSIHEYEGEKQRLCGIFKNDAQHTSYYKNDMVTIKLSTRSGFGYSMLIKIVGDTFRCKVKRKGGCMGWHPNLIVTEQKLQLIPFELKDHHKIKGAIYCKTKEGILIQGDFESTLFESTW